MPDRDPRSGNLVEACLCAGTIIKHPRFLEGDRRSPFALCSSNNSLLAAPQNVLGYRRAGIDGGLFFRPPA